MNDDFAYTDDGLIYFPNGADDFDTEPQFRVAKDRSGVTHVEVQEGWSEHVIWEINGKEMVKTYDEHETIF